MLARFGIPPKLRNDQKALPQIGLKLFAIQKRPENERLWDSVL